MTCMSLIADGKLHYGYVMLTMEIKIIHTTALTKQDHIPYFLYLLYNPKLKML